MRVLLAIDGPDQFHPAVKALARQQLLQESERESFRWSMRGYRFRKERSTWECDDVAERGLPETARVAVQKAAAVFRDDEHCRSLTVTTDVLSGSPAEDILEDAEAFGAHWIFVGSHGQGRLERFALASVSQAVAGLAICSVAIVRGPRARSTEE